MNFTAREKEIYEGTLKWFQIEANTLKKAEARGEARGITIGEARGITIGEARGEARAIEKMVLELLKQKYDVDLICRMSGLSKAQVRRMQKNPSLETENQVPS